LLWAETEIFLSRSWAPANKQTISSIMTARYLDVWLRQLKWRKAYN
jgi:hypothetical protein